MMTSMQAPIQRRTRALSRALDQVLGPVHRSVVRELASAESGARNLAPHQVLSWMRVNMPRNAERVDDVLFPEGHE